MDFDLNKTISQLSIDLVKTQVNKLKTECDEAVERDLGRRIRTLLREVDTLRTQYNSSKRKLVDEMQNTLMSLGSNAETINHAVLEISSIRPTWLSVIPESSVLANNSPTPAISHRQEQQHNVDNLSALRFIPANARASGDQPDQHTLGKHPREDDEADGNTRKMPKTGDQGKFLDISHRFPRALKVTDLRPFEFVFCVSGFDGCYVLRCSEENCRKRHFLKSPFLYKRGYRHFNLWHPSDFLKSESYIFKSYGYKVEGATMEQLAARHPDHEIPTFAYSEDEASKDKNPDDKDEDTTSKHRKTDNDDKHTADEAKEAPSHNLRSQPKRSYVAMHRGHESLALSDEAPKSKISNRDRLHPDNVVPSTNTAIPRADSVASLRGSVSISNQAAASKPFGHTGEWPRRSAPR